MRRLLLCVCWSVCLLPIRSLAAPTAPLPATVSPPEQLQPGKCEDKRTAIAATNTVLPLNNNIPSLWLTRIIFEAKEKFEGRLIDNWLVCLANSTTSGRIDLVVNPQSWSILDYIERYDFVNRFGYQAQDYGYNVVVFDTQERREKPLAAYTCNFGQTPRVCSVELQVRGKARVRGAVPSNSQ